MSADSKLEAVAYVVTQWDANTRRSLPIELKIFSRNVGTRSAHNALFTMIFPKETLITQTNSAFPVRPDISGGWRFWDKQPDVHPEVYSDHTITLTVDEGLKDGFPIMVTVSLDDYPTAKQVLGVKFLRTSREAETKQSEPKGNA